MELQRPSPPATLAFQDHDPSQLVLPTVPNHDLGASQRIQLPCIRSVLSPEFEEVIRRHDKTHSRYASLDSTNTLPRMEMGSAMSPVRSIEHDFASNASSPKTTTISLEERRGRPQSVISVEDPDVRIAAEALSGLGHTNYLQSPPGKQSVHITTTTLNSDEVLAEPEPLLQLFAQAHPWVGGTINGTINGSMYAYNTTKYFSPGFIRHGANLVERNIATPVVNTVGNVGRYTGVENGIRRYLGGRRPSELDRPFLLPKDGDTDMTGTTTSRRDSTETLPAYRPSKPPSYREEYSPAGLDRERAESSRAAAAQRTWPTNVAGQMFVMTSGLGIALSITSRRSLQYCLSLLSQAIEHVATVMKALRMVLEQYDQARDSWRKQHSADLEKAGVHTDEDDEASRRLAELIKQHCDDIWQTLKTVVNSVSTTTGGALPENARHFVRTQLMSLPQRWRLVSEHQAGEGETSQTAHRMIAFATEGLDMMNQVSQVVRATLDSAERWLERVGRRDVPAVALQEKDADMMDTAP